MTNFMRRFYNSGDALIAIKQVFGQTTLLRIATAYFEASGYHLLRDVLVNKDIRLLVGREQGAKDRLEDVIKEFVNSLSMGSQLNRTGAMRQMLDALEQGYLEIQVGDDPVDDTSVIDGRYLYQHAKMYIGDETAAVITSANMSAHGLQRSREAGEVVTDAEGVDFFIDRFETYFQKAASVTQRFIEELRAYLGDYDPYFIYARALVVLYRLPDEAVPPQLPILAEYQKPAVTRVKTTIEEHGGAYFVASTGLGKTVMAAHVVAYLRMLGLIDNVIIICPAGLRENWRRFMRASRTSSVEFSYHTLSADDYRKNRELLILEHELRGATEQTLVIVDESHHLRTDEKGERERNKRIRDIVREKNAKILLLTATPFSKGVDDINAQLNMLPQPKNPHRTDLGLYVNAGNWRVETSGELSELPTCFVLTTPIVVKHFGYMDEQTGERYIAFGDEKRYFPTVLKLRTVTYKNPMDNFLVELFESQLLYSMNSENITEGQLTLFDLQQLDPHGKRNPLFESQLVHQFCSSPAKVEDFCVKVMNGFSEMKFARQQELEDFLSKWDTKLKQWLKPDNDTKLQKLAEIIENASPNKIVVFCYYIETAKHLHKYLQKILPKNIIVETTAEQRPESMDKILQRFAPIANEVEEEIQEAEIQVLIATGSISEGFNLQDAAILVNYDLPWTVLQLAQRMGRILRPWLTPRDITIYNFIPSTMQDTHYMAQNWHKRLINYGNEFRSFAEIPILLRDVERESNWEMVELARGLNLVKEADLDLEEIMDFIGKSEQLQTTTFYDDLAMIPNHDADDLKNLPPGIRSARLVSKGKSQLFVLFLYNKKYYPALFDIDGNLKMGSENPDAIMKIIRCSRAEQRAPFNLYPKDDDFDEWIEKSKQTWATKFDVEDVNRVQIICSMALIRDTT